MAYERQKDIEMAAKGHKAEDGLYRRLDGPELIDLGNWQMHLRKSLADYLSFEPPEAANSMLSKDAAS